VRAATAINDAASTNEDVAVTIRVLDNDSGSGLKVASVTAPGNGSAVILDESADTIRYTPTCNWNGTDTFTYTVTEGSALASATVTITVTAVNDAPSFTKGANQTVLEDCGSQVVPGWATSMTAGPANESSQTLTFVVTNDNNKLFNLQPAVSSDTGTLIYSPLLNKSGLATVTVLLRDNGSTENNGANTSPARTFTITVGPVNDAPTGITLSSNSIAENAVAGTQVGYFVTQDVDNTFGFVYTLSGTDAGAFAMTNTNYLVTSRSLDFETKNTYMLHVRTTDPGSLFYETDFKILVTNVNDVPSFTKGADQTVLEDCGVQTVSGWATNVSAGPSNESGQTLNFIVTNDNSALFAVQPAVSPTGTLAYTPALNMNGSAIVTVQIHDDGGTANGGVDTSVSQTFFLTVSEVNDAPTAVDDAYPMLEDGILTLTPAQLLSNDVRGPVNESAQNLALVDVGAAHVNCIVSLDAAIITVRPTPDFNGTASFSYTIQDNGTTAGTPDPKAASGIVTIMVTAVNDIPSFTKGADQTVLEDRGLQTVAGWATSISAGPADESGQALNFIVTNDNTTLFSAQPAVAANSTLTYTPALNMNGSAIVTVQIHDDGGTANGGVDTSTPQTFTITVTAVNDPPVNTYTLIYAAGANGSISGASPQTVNYGASGSAVTAVPNTGYHFVQWSDGNGNATRTDTNVTMNVNVSASFAINININIHRYTLTANVSGSGSVAKSPDQSSYTHGTSVQLMATPATGWHFAGWSGDLSGTTNPVTITMDVSKTVTATYAPLPHPVSGHTMVLTIDIKTMTVDSVRVVLDAPAAIVEDRTLVPLRAVVEHLGGSIVWDAKTRQVTLKARGTTISLTIGKSTALVNGKPLVIDPKNSKVVPLISSGRTMLPLRFVAENLGLQVGWDAKARTITVSWED
jgi:VCBS repeat-containing protein